MEGFGNDEKQKLDVKIPLRQFMGNSRNSPPAWERLKD
jgi:hypothetical protein